MVNRQSARREEEPHVYDVAADDDLVSVVEMPSFDIDGEATAGKPQQRGAQRARKFIVRRARSDGFTHREGDQIA